MTIRALDFASESADWTNRANCTDPSINPDWFFPISEHDTSLEQRAALSICQKCPVKIECLNYALEHWPLYGIWGGLKNKDIKQLAERKKEKK